MNSYKTLIPVSLHQEVEQLFDYLTYTPFEKPDACCRCESNQFYATGNYSRPNKQQPIYYCVNCKKQFTQLTNTIFNKSWHLEKWVYVGRAYLAGLSTIQIAQQTNVSTSAVLFRCKAIDRLMEEKYPKLYCWWQEHRERIDLRFTNDIKQQANTFLNWLDNLINKQNYTCPHCQQKMYKADNKSVRPNFVCYHCKYYFNPLNTTYFKGVKQIERWKPYAEKLMEGYSCKDLEQLIGVKNKTAVAWQHTFIAQMKLLGLTELIQWITWQRKRRYAQVSKINHQHNKQMKDQI